MQGASSQECLNERSLQQQRLRSGGRWLTAALVGLAVGVLMGICCLLMLSSASDYAGAGVDVSVAAQLDGVMASEVGRSTNTTRPSQTDEQRPDALWKKTAWCLADVHDSAMQWVNCVEKTPAKSNALKWKEGNVCGFSRMLYKDYTSVDAVAAAKLRALLASSTIEFLGDSTLRELVGVLVGQVGVGSLEKQHANKGLRAPKYFVKIGDPEVVNADLSGVAKGYSTVPLARLAFRFDFLGISLKEPMVDAPIFNVSSRETALSAQPFFHPNDGTTRRLLVLSIGSHAAKHLVTKYSGQNVTSSHVSVLFASLMKTFRSGYHQPCTTEVNDILFGLFVGPIEDYLVERVLGLSVVRKGLHTTTTPQKFEEGPLLKEELMIGSFLSFSPITTHLRSSHSPNQSQSTHASQKSSVTTAVIVGQTFECGAMFASSVRGFRVLAPYCERMEHVISAVYKYWEDGPLRLLSSLRRVSDSITDESQLLHPNSSWRQLTFNQRQRLAASVQYLPALRCHQHNSEPFQFDVSKPHCTKDGIHLRTKFLVQKLDALLNIMVRSDLCSLHTS